MNTQQPRQPSPFAPPAAPAAAAPSVLFSNKPPSHPTTTTTTFAASTNNASTTTNGGINNKPASLTKHDVSVPMPGDDGTSSLSFSPSNNNNINLLVSSNWDSGVRCWKVEKNQQNKTGARGGGRGGAMMQVQAIPQAMVHHEHVVLDTCFSPDGTKVFSVGGDKAVRVWELGHQLPAASSNQILNIAPQVGAHDAPIRSVRFLKAHGGLVVSGGWDGKVKFWDARSDKPAAVLSLSERVHAMDVQDNLLVVATADQKIVAYDCSSNEPRPLLTKNPFKNDQVRCITCFPDATGYAIGGIGGRVAVEYLQDVPRAADLKSFKFSCQRDAVSSPQERCSVHAVNSISFYGTHKLATTGSDGKIAFWDKQGRTKLRNFDAIQRPIPCATFSADSTLLAYASSDDWSKGCMHALPGNQVFLHSMTTL